MADADHKPRKRFADHSATIWEHYRSGGSNIVGSAIPHIRLSGKWIEQAGFIPAHCIKIEVWEGMLIITPIDESKLDRAIFGAPARVKETGLRRRVRLPDDMVHPKCRVTHK